MHRRTREIRLAEALVESADTLVDGFEAAHYLSGVADHCVGLLAARGAGFMLIDDGRAVSLAAGGADREIALELLRAQYTGGPCPDSYSSGRPVPPVSIRAARTDSRWPEFTERALAHDIATTYAVPLRRRGGCSARSTSSAPPAPATPRPRTVRRCGWRSSWPTARPWGWRTTRRTSSAAPSPVSCSRRCPAGCASNRPRACSPSAGALPRTTPSWRCGSTHAGADCRWTGSRRRSSTGSRTTPNCAGRRAVRTTRDARSTPADFLWAPAAIRSGVVSGRPQPPVGRAPQAVTAPTP